MNLPTIYLQPGLRLYHGTDALNHFDIPTGPAWFSQSLEVAEWFKSWHSQGGKPRILKYEVTAPVKLLAIRTSAELNDIAEEFGLDFTSEPDSLCSAGLGVAGWNVIGNYAPTVPGQQAGDDIMLCDPERWLRRLGR